MTEPLDKAERMRSLLRRDGPQTACDLANAVGLPSTGGVWELLKDDVARYDVYVVGEFYHWRPSSDSRRKGLS
jgi:hypothetical protein